jgi:small-conductance mechanosensitive channel
MKIIVAGIISLLRNIALLPVVLISICYLVCGSLLLLTLIVPGVVLFQIYVFLQKMRLPQKKEVLSYETPAGRYGMRVNTSQKIEEAEIIQD